jgi:hypothetical protein
LALLLWIGSTDMSELRFRNGHPILYIYSVTANMTMCFHRQLVLCIHPSVTLFEAVGSHVTRRRRGAGSSSGATGTTARPRRPAPSSTAAAAWLPQPRPAGARAAPPATDATRSGARARRSRPRTCSASQLSGPDLKIVVKSQSRQNSVSASSLSGPDLKIVGKSQSVQNSGPDTYDAEVVHDLGPPCAAPDRHLLLRPPPPLVKLA